MIISDIDRKISSCIYAIQEGSVVRYVGSTRRALSDRHKNHLSQLNKHKHSNPTLQEIWNKSTETWRIIVLEVCSDKESLRDRENHWISLYSGSLNQLADSRGRGRVFSKDTKERMRASRIAHANKPGISEQNSEAVKNAHREGRLGFDVLSEEAQQRIRDGAFNKPIRAKSGYRGVSARKWGYCAYICLDKKCYDLGVYSTADEAALAYNKKNIELRGTNAFQNTIGG